MPAKDPGPVLTPHEVRDGTRVLRFEGWLLGRSSSQRPSVPRWSEIEVYRLISGGYVLTKIGRSTVAHTPTCSRVGPRMPAYIDVRDHEEAQVHRVPCPECRPVVGDRMDPQTRLEPTRFRASYVLYPESVVDTLAEGRAPAGLPMLISRAIEESSQNDDDLAKAWASARGLADDLNP